MEWAHENGTSMWNGHMGMEPACGMGTWEWNQHVEWVLTHEEREGRNLNSPLLAIERERKIEGEDS